MVLTRFTNQAIWWQRWGKSNRTSILCGAFMELHHYKWHASRYREWEPGEPFTWEVKLHFCDIYFPLQCCTRLIWQCRGAFWFPRRWCWVHLKRLLLYWEKKLAFQTHSCESLCVLGTSSGGFKVHFITSGSQRKSLSVTTALSF